ncbi:MAG: transketolase [Planctomycetota bacterium]|jgi:transketolase
MTIEAAIHDKAIQFCGDAVEMCAAAGSGHPTTAMSISHITAVLTHHAMRWVPSEPWHPGSDRLVLSEGHAVPAVYAALADLGAVVGKEGSEFGLTRDHLLTLRDTDSVLDGHPNPAEGMPFFDAATGSLGQGLSVAAGIALAALKDEVDRKVYCILGDGEAREGQVAEALDFIIDHNITNVLPIFNCNGYGQADATSSQQSPERMVAKLQAIGFAVFDIDGHDPVAILEAIDGFKGGSEQPMAIVARTIKGWGAPCLQGHGWHGKVATGTQLEQVREELGLTSMKLTSAISGEAVLRIEPPASTPEEQFGPENMPTLAEAMNSVDKGLVLKSGKFATRKAFGMALRMLARNDKRVWALDADTRNSTFTQDFLAEPEATDRFAECKIAEQNMVSVAAGLAAAEKVPFCASFSKFLTRAYDQIEMAIISRANIKIVGSHSGISLAADGPSQMSLPDMAWFRSFTTAKTEDGEPLCWLLQPSDAYAAYGLTMAMAEHNGPCLLRTHRPDVEHLYDDNTVFNLGLFEVLTEGRDLLIVSAGYMVHECNRAIDLLDKAGIDATLVDLYSIPFDEDALLDLANANGGNILVVEDNFGAAIGSAVADACTASGDPFTIEQMHVRKIPKSSRSEDDVLAQCGLDAASIAKKAGSMVGVAVRS